MGNFTLAGEYNDYDFDFHGVGGIDGRAWMLMANYAFTDRVGGTLRYSNEDWDHFDTWKLSLGPSIRVTENLLTRFEYSYGEADLYDEGTDGGDRDIHMFVAEGLFTF